MDYSVSPVAKLVFKMDRVEATIGVVVEIFDILQGFVGWQVRFDRLRYGGHLVLAVYNAENVVVASSQGKWYWRLYKYLNKEDNLRGAGNVKELEHHIWE